MAGYVKLREASFEDYAQIASLESRHGLAAKGHEEWHHLWICNPAYRGFQGDWPIGWVLEDRDGRIVGSIGNIPLPYEFEGRKILAATGRAWVAEPDYRGASLMLLERVVNQPAADVYLNNTVTEESADAINSLGCARVPVGVWNESAFWITDHPAFFQSLLTKKGYPFPKLMSYPLAASVILKEWTSKNALRESDVQVKACMDFDDRFEGLWALVRRNSPHALLAVRTREVLRWHFKYALRNRRLWIAAVMNGGSLSAYAAFDRRDNPKFGLKRARLVDFQSHDNSTALLAPLLMWALRRCAEEGVHMLENTGCWLEKGELMKTAAPYRRQLSTWTYLYRANNSKLVTGLRDRRTWAPSLFDGNASL